MEISGVPEGTGPDLPRWVVPAMAGLVGAVALIASIGPSNVHPTNIDWLMHADYRLHFLGWHLYRASPWTLPIGATPLHIWPVGSSVGPDRFDAGRLGPLQAARSPVAADLPVHRSLVRGVLRATGRLRRVVDATGHAPAGSPVPRRGAVHPEPAAHLPASPRGAHGTLAGTGRPLAVAERGRGHTLAPSGGGLGVARGDDRRHPALHPADDRRADARRLPAPGPGRAAPAGHDCRARRPRARRLLDHPLAIRQLHGRRRRRLEHRRVRGMVRESADLHHAHGGFEPAVAGAHRVRPRDAVRGLRLPRRGHAAAGTRRARHPRDVTTLAGLDTARLAAPAADSGAPVPGRDGVRSAGDLRAARPVHLRRQLVGAAQDLPDQRPA